MMIGIAQYELSLYSNTSLVRGFGMKYFERFHIIRRTHNAYLH